MAVAADKNLSQGAQQKINDITARAQRGEINWDQASKEANAVRASEGANYTATASGQTVYSGGSGSGSGSSGGTSGSTWKPSSGYTEQIGADAGLTQEQLDQIQGYRDQAKAGLITWDQANQAANAIRMAAGGYSVDRSGNASYVAPPSGQYQSFDEFLGDMGYDSYAEQTQAAIQAAVQAAIDKYKGQIETTNQDSDKMARQAYVAKMLGQKNLDQQMAAGGYAGGMADSQRIATETNYENQLSDIEQQRLDTIRELESAMRQAELSGDMQTAQELAAYLQQIQGQWASYVQNREQMANQNYWNSRNLGTQNYWNQQEMNAQNKEAAYTRALNLISQGFMPDEETLSAAGISTLEAQNRLQQVRSQLAGNTGGTAVRSSRSSYNSGGGPVSDEPVNPPEDDEATGGTLTDLEREARNIENYERSSAAVQNTLQTIRSLLQAKDFDTAIERYNEIFETLSEPQKKALNNLMIQYGAAG